MFRFACIIFAMITLSLPAIDLPKSVNFKSNGVFRIGGLDFIICGTPMDWRNFWNQQWTQVDSKLNSDNLSVSGIVPLKNSTASVNETITATGENSFQVKFHAKFDKPTQLRALRLMTRIPTSTDSIIVDGKEVTFPSEFKYHVCYRNNQCKSLVFSVDNGTEIEITGDPLNIAIQDNRINADSIYRDTFSLQLEATPNKGEMFESNLVLNFKVSPFKCQKIDLSKAANADFSDEVAGDGKGGWTDQGKDNDLRMIKPGAIKAGAIEFNVLDASQNQHQGAIVVCGEKRNFLGPQATLELPPNQAGAINLLHASAWPQSGLLGSIVATYQDGTSQRIPVRNRIDCNNWAGPSSVPNAVVAWNDENPVGTVGLYASSFALEKKGPTALRFEIESPISVWMIAGVTLSNHRFSPGSAVANTPLVTKENAQWKPLDFQRTLSKGSALDFSFLADAPAGKYGFIRPASNGGLTFEKAPNKRIRLYGANLCFTANYLSAEYADQLADYLTYSGYNTIRFHHHDGMLLDPNAPDSVTLSASQLDKLDYLVYRLKQNGIYVTTDLYTSRKFKSGDNIPVDNVDQGMMAKMLVPIVPEAMACWKEFTKRWMNHPNPYTKLAWKDDPTLYCINLLNEDSLMAVWSNSKESTKIYTEGFKKYCAENNLPNSKAVNTNPVFCRYIYTIQAKSFDEQIRFLKQELGFKAMVTSLNCYDNIPLTLLRDKFDLVDNHQYVDLPSFPEGKKWTLPNAYGQVSPIRRMGVLPRLMMPTRIPGKPFIVTEFNYVNPNIYRSVAGPMIGAYASLQNWDALYRFAWTHSDRKIKALSEAFGFDLATDPLALLSDRIAIAMFRRGDVDSAKEIYTYPVANNCIEKGNLGDFPISFSNLGLITQIGSSTEDTKTLPTGIKTISEANISQPESLADTKIAQLWKQAIENKLAVSSTNQIRLDGKNNTFTVTTPNTESITLESGNLKAGCLSVKNVSCYQTIAAISLDQKSIPESSSILVIHLTNLSNTGDHYDNSSKRLVRKIGKLPLLLEKGSADIELTLNHPCKITALNCDGIPVGTVESQQVNGTLRFTADNQRFPGGVMVYHLTRE